MADNEVEVQEQEGGEDIMHLEEDILLQVPDDEIEIIQEQAEGESGEEEAADIIPRIGKETINKNDVAFSSTPSTSKEITSIGVNDKDFYEVTLTH